MKGDEHMTQIIRSLIIPAPAFSVKTYAAIFDLYVLTMLAILAVTVTHHVRRSILNEFYGREES